MNITFFPLHLKQDTIRTESIVADDLDIAQILIFMETEINKISGKGDLEEIHKKYVEEFANKCKSIDALIKEMSATESKQNDLVAKIQANIEEAYRIYCLLCLLALYNKIREQQPEPNDAQNTIITKFIEDIKTKLEGDKVLENKSPQVVYVAQMMLAFFELVKDIQAKISVNGQLIHPVFAIQVIQALTEQLVCNLTPEATPRRYDTFAAGEMFEHPDSLTSKLFRLVQNVEQQFITLLSEEKEIQRLCAEILSKLGIKLPESASVNKLTVADSQKDTPLKNPAEQRRSCCVLL